MQQTITVDVKQQLNQINERDEKRNGARGQGI